MRPYAALAVALLAACADPGLLPDDDSPSGPVNWSEPQLFVRRVTPEEQLPSGVLPDTLRFHGYPAGGPPGGVVTWALAGGPSPANPEQPRTQDFRFSVGRANAQSVQIETCPMGLYCITNMPVIGALSGNVLFFEQWPGRRYVRLKR